MTKLKTYDLNLLLRICNIFLTVLAVYMCITIGTNEYVDWFTIGLLASFAIENHLLLLSEKKSRDPFVILLMLNIILFYMLRVVTLLYVPWSTFLSRFKLVSSDVNYAIIFIMLGVLSIFLGLKSVKGKITYYTIAEGDYYNGKPASPLGVILILSIAVLNYFIIINFNVSFLGRLVGYMSTLINPDLITLFTIVYLLLYSRLISLKYLYIIFALITSIIVLRTIGGVRSGILTVLILTVVAILSVYGKIIINRKVMFIFLLIVPIMIATFGYATYSRALTFGMDPSMQKKPSVMEYIDMTFNSNDHNIKEMLRPIFNRTGFLDMATDIIIGNNKYGKVINPQYYLTSTKLVPGFNTLFMPRAANNLVTIYQDSKLLALTEVDKNYQSDMFTAFGETYVLFYGYPALIVLYLFGFLFKKIYISFTNADPCLSYFYKAFVLFVYYQLWLLSFGIDWIIIELVKYFITIMIFKRFYITRGHKHIVPIWKRISKTI